MVTETEGLVWGEFRRHLTPDALKAFQGGPLAMLLDVFRDAMRPDRHFSVNLRGTTIGVYEGGSLIAELQPPTARRGPRLGIARAYIDNIRLEPHAVKNGGASTSSSQKRFFHVTREFVADWQTQLDAVIDRSKEVHANVEGRWEARIMAANPPGSPVECLDRQIQIPRIGKEKGPALRLDILALATVAGEDAMIAIEVKRELDARIDTLHAQVTPYIDMLGGVATGLRPSIAVSYSLCAEQCRSLKLPFVAPDRIRPGMPVHALVVLARYNRRSERLARAIKNAAERMAGGHPKIYAHVLEGESCVLPGAPWKSLSDPELLLPDSGK